MRLDADAKRAVVMDAAGIDRALNRIAHQIVERYHGLGDLALVGIRSRGVPLAHRLAKILGATEKRAVPVGILDITLYRDDLTTIGPHPVLKETSLSFPIEGRRIVLVDDVLYTGRTIRAALDGLIDFGRPKSIALAVLVDRGHRELPIHADYVGKTVATGTDEVVAVRLREIDGEDEVLLSRRPAPRAADAPATRAAGAAKRRATAGARAPRRAAAKGR